MLNPDTTTIELSRDELERYSRHLILPEVGLEGQKKLKAASVLCVGTGGLGAPLTMYLAAAGIGRIGLVDFDVVDASNLQRQIIHGTSWIGKPKIDSATDRLQEINPHLQIDRWPVRLSSENALDICRDYDLIIDGTDNFPTRYLVNDACVLLGKPNVYGSIFRFEGQSTVFHYEDGPCYRCLYPEPPPPGLVPSCAEGGVLGILPGVIGVIQATEAVKIILGIGTTLKGRLMLYDALNMKFRELKLRRNPECPVCGDHPTVTSLIDYEEFCGIPQARAEEEKAKATLQEITATELNQMLDAGKDIVIVDVRNPDEFAAARIPGTTLVPLPEIEQGPGVEKVRSLVNGSTLVLHCRSGMRSAKALQILQSVGIEGINLKGGIHAWSDEVDPSVPKV
ncbi:molybdopterin-synthase adenylyltransferase MoeB [Gloeobacter morelensis]|uniref:Molybdopterin-synthase adenylyltransferase MoeB n=1 Tax=Gloeobacter morelensis MG652769 TaxID=2781736 RepID=A0ABY3PH05_9CYAN|nr:molybdopterin-synthase adenylyltransferase MoeB [Gloeobacter morelensis]UFP92927.1 molybdopterin-synthase adenylyltransferase MoeB [Gloeobacter morelensis MG652769]